MAEPVNPNTLVANVAKPRLTVSMIISFVVHIVLLLVFSIGFLQLCAKYHTIHPKAAIKIEKKLAEAAAEQQRKEDAMKNAQLKAKEEAEKASKEASEGKDAGKDAAKAAVKAAAPKREKSDIEKKLEETLPPNTAKSSVEEGLSL